MQNDPRISDANGKGIAHWMAALQIEGLRRSGHDHSGPCPICGGDNRFSINTVKDVFQCRRCEGKGDSVALVMFVKGLKFLDALEWMCGPKQELSQEELDKRAAAAAKVKEAKDRDAAQYRAQAIAQAREIWAHGRAFAGSPAEAYLRLRGIVVPQASFAVLRYAPDLKYMVSNPDESSQDKYLRAHVGPAMLARVDGQNDQICAVHRTWFDLTQPQGKVRILHPVTGKVQARKKGFGSKKGGAIRLVRGTNTTMVMGEGIETTFSAHVAGVFEGAHFWAGVDLGNMSGSRMIGKGLKYAGQPDLTDADAFVPPPWVQRLIYIQDGDSDPRETRAKLLAGLRRAKHHIPDLHIQIAACPTGFDLNDVLLGEVGDGKS